MGTRAALCVGINSFSYFPSYKLKGCVNDAASLAAMASTLLDVPDEHVQLLTEGRATKARIIDSLEGLVCKATEGVLDSILFSFSTHGTQVPDQNGDEPDSMDEAFLPHDVMMHSDGLGWKEHSIIRDDELFALFGRVPKEVNVEVILDTCHSGAGLCGAEFGLSRASPRYVSPPGSDLYDATYKRAKKNRPPENPYALSPVVWAACTEGQTCADAFLGGKYYGAFTYALGRVLRSPDGTELRREEVLHKVSKILHGKFCQTAQLSATKEQKGSRILRGL